MTDKDQDRQRFGELLPFYVNDTLGAEDQAWMDSYLTAHPELQNEKRFVERLAKLTKETVSSVPEAQRLEQFLGKWRESRAQRSWLRRLAGWIAIGIRGGMRVPMPALGAVAMLVLVQSIIIASLVPENHQEETFRGQRPECSTGARLRVVFMPDAKYVDIVLLLRRLDLTVREGPSESGEFWVTAPKERSAEEVQTMLRASALVQDVVLAPAQAADPKCDK